MKPRPSTNNDLRNSPPRQKQNSSSPNISSRLRWSSVKTIQPRQLTQWSRALPETTCACPLSLNFPFGYLESSFIDSLKFTFGCFPPAWLKYFKRALVPLLTFNLLDSCHATLVSHPYFTAEGLFVIDWSMYTEDLLHTQLHLAKFVCMLWVPTRPFLFLTPLPIELPL